MKKYILPFLFLSILPYHALAQITTQGTDFYVSFGNNAAGGGTYSTINMQIRIAASQATTVTLTFKNTGTVATVNIAAGGVYTRNLSAAEKNAVYSSATGTSNKSLRIQSTTPVSVYALNQFSATTDATNVLPVNNLGTDYFQVSYKGLNTYPDGYTVIATVDNTIIYENGASKATLNAGQVYSAYYNGLDITGRRITSNHPIAYFVTNECVNIPVGTTACDCLYQQMVPVNSWGNTFLVPVTHRGKERVRVVASQNGTTVTQTGGTKKTDGGGGAINPSNQNSFTLNAGQYAEFEIALTTNGAYISADKPIAVASYLIGMSYAAGLTDAVGDPALAWVPPVEQAADMAVIAPFAPTSNTVLTKHYALVVTPTATRSNTTVAIGSGAPTALSGGSWRTGNGNGSGLSFYSLQLTNTTASYFFNNPAGLTVMGYGTGNYESYYYLSGAAGRNLNPSFYINDIHYQDIDGNVICGQTSFHLKAVAQFYVSPNAGFLKWYINGVEETAARDDYEWDKTLSPGTYNVEMRIIDANNQTHVLPTTFTVKNQAVAATITTTGTSACSGATATLTGSSISGVTNPVYRWYDSQTATTPLYTGATYTTPALTASKTYYVSVEANNYCENVVNTRKAVTVTVYGTLTAGSVGSAQTICYNTTPAAFTQTGAPSGGIGTYEYQWQSSPNGSSSWSNIPGATSATYAHTTNLTAGIYFRRVVTSGSCGTVYSASVRITVRAELSPGSIGSPQTICYNTAPATLAETAAASGGAGTYTYQWQSSQNNTLWTNISGATLASYTPGALMSPMYFRRNVTDASCGTVYGESILINIYPNLSPGSIGSNQSICHNTAPTFTPTAPSGGFGSYSYQWKSSTDNVNWTPIPGATSASYTSGALTSSAYFRREVTDSKCGTVYSSILVTVHPVVTVNAISNKEGCINNSVPATTFTSPTAGVTFTWTNSNTAIGLGASGTGNQPQFTATQPGTATITVTPYYSGCPGTPSTYTLTISSCLVPVNPHLRTRIE